MSTRYVIPLNCKRVRVATAGECPDCLSKVDAASSPEGRTPKPGDFSCCALCGCLMRYTSTMEVRRMEDHELEELEPEQRDLLLRYHRSFRATANAMADPRVKAVMLSLPRKNHE